MLYLLTHLLHTVVYNARKRGEDRASDYFKRTENVAGVKDMRFQALMPDILHWLGITKIDRMLSMSKFVHPFFLLASLSSAMAGVTTAGNFDPCHRSVTGIWFRSRLTNVSRCAA